MPGMPHKTTVTHVSTGQALPIVKTTHVEHIYVTFIKHKSMELHATR